MTAETSRRQGQGNRCPAISFQELLDQEKVAVPPHLRACHTASMGDEDLSVDRYTSRAFHQREKEKLWPRVWQLVCREEEIGKVGDHLIYDIVDDSLIVARTADDTIQAFVNSCLHRGRALRTENGRVQMFRCPYHGFTWNLDGSFRSKPCAWDFPHVDAAGFKLREVRVGRWGGFVFVNFDPAAPPLREYLGVLPEHFERYAIDAAATAMHVQKVIRCNWKLAHEAFLESFHVLATHPQILTFTADANTQYDTFGDHISRMITPMAVHSPHVRNISQTQIMRDILEKSGRMVEHSAAGLELPPGMSAREFIGEMNRKAFEEAIGSGLEQATLAELQDAILYDVFPNMQVWAGYNGNIVYQFRPNGDDHESCIFDVRILLHSPDRSRPIPVAAAHRLTEEEPFASATELGALGPVFDQDMGNLRWVMKGLKASKKGTVTLGRYQESRIRHLHATLDKYLGA